MALSSLDGALRALELAGLSGLRPSWVALACAAAGAAGLVVFPESLRFLATWPGVAALAVVALLEPMAERDLDFGEIFGSLQLGLSVASALLSTEVVAAQAGARGSIALRVGAVALAILTVGLRRKLKARLAEWTAALRSPTRWFARAEESAWVLAVVLVIYAPIVLLGAMLLAVLGGVALLVAARAWDSRQRRACPNCATPARREALRCPSCRAELEPDEWLVRPAAFVRAGEPRAVEPIGEA
jgi:hypothetical protein